MSKKEAVDSLVKTICHSLDEELCNTHECGDCKAHRLAEDLYDCNYRQHKEVEHIPEIIALLSEMKAGYSIFDPSERPKYHALSMAIQVLNEIKED